MHFIRIFGYVSKKLLFTLFPDSKILLPPTLWYMPWDMWRWYGDAFNDFADCCDKFLTQAHTGEPYDGDNMPKGTVHPVYIPISLLFGFLISLLIGRSKSAKLKSVRKKESAADYQVAGSMRLYQNSDVLVASNVTSRVVSSSSGSSSGGSSTHTSSSGRSHGGTSGKFWWMETIDSQYEKGKRRIIHFQ